MEEDIISRPVMRSVQSSDREGYCSQYALRSGLLTMFARVERRRSPAKIKSKRDPLWAAQERVLQLADQCLVPGS